METKKKAGPPVDGADQLGFRFGFTSRTPNSEAYAKISFEVTGLDGFDTIESQDALLRCFAQCSHQVYMQLAEHLRKTL